MKSVCWWKWKWNQAAIVACVFTLPSLPVIYFNRTDIKATANDTASTLTVYNATTEYSGTIIGNIQSHSSSADSWHPQYNLNVTVIITGNNTIKNQHISILTMTAKLFENLSFTLICEKRLTQLIIKFLLKRYLIIMESITNLYISLNRICITEDNFAWSVLQHCPPESKLRGVTKIKSWFFVLSLTQPETRKLPNKSATGSLPCCHQIDIRMRSHCLLQLDDNKSAESFQQTCCKLINCQDFFSTSLMQVV